MLETHDLFHVLVNHKTFFQFQKMTFVRHIFSLLFTLFSIHEANIIQIKIGLFFPADSTTFQPTMGYNTSAGAINLALDRIQQEQLIPNINFRCIVQTLIVHLLHLQFLLGER